MTLPPLPALLTLATLLAAASPAAATGPWQPPQRHQHHQHQAQPICPARPDTARHSRGSDVPMRGERDANTGCVPGRRPGPLHHLFHGRRH
jgi:hypothetical protein